VGKKFQPGVNDLATMNPELAAQWHPTKNGSLSPQDFTEASEHKAYWLCEKGHDWRTSIRERNKGSKCPNCAGQRAWNGFNDMATTNPELAAQWHPTMNGDLKPALVMAGTNKKIWWSCKHGHAWQATGGTRLSGSGCPYCSGRYVDPGFNDLFTANPELAAQWHPAKNGNLTPRDVVAGTARKFWWVCDKGHEWRATGNSRVWGTGKGCPVCAGQSVLSGFNDLASTNPLVAREWHPTKNESLTPDQVTAGSGRRVWWLCPQGHEHYSQISTRVNGSGCAVCQGRSVLNGVNDMATTNPELAAQWHPKLNGNLLPTDVVATTNKSIWWQCEKGHSWRAVAGNRVRLNQGCPYCSNYKVLAGFNDMATTNPELAEEWHPTKNGNLTPRDVVAGTARKMWWMCEQGHEWKTSGNSRIIGTGCPVCAPFGFDSHKPGILYFIANRELYARKVGITNIGTTRLAAFAKTGWRQLLAVENEDGRLVRAVESAIFKWLRDEQGLPQYLSKEDMKRTAGATETFSEDGPSDHEIMERIRAEFSRLSAEGKA
jgi:hypothetical protein